MLMELGESVFLKSQGKNKDQAKNKGKGKVPIQVDVKKESKCFFCKIRDTLRRIAPSFSNGSKRKVIQSPTFVSNLIWLKLIITHPRLTLVL